MPGAPGPTRVETNKEGTVTMTTLERTDEIIVIDKRAQDILFRDAHTANTFTDEPVDDDHVRAIYDLVKWAPTSFNQQPLRVVLVRDQNARQRLVNHMIDNNKAKTLAAPLTAILAADKEFHENLPTQFPAVPYAKDFYADPAAREESARLNAALQVAYFIVGIRAAGLAAGPMSGFNPAGIDAEFFPDGRHTTLVVVNIGRPGENSHYPRGPRLEYDEVFRTA
jgi:3-hydroxypropanoate dehydrogenase